MRPAKLTLCALALPALLGLAGCDPWDLPDQSDNWRSDSTWSADLVATANGVFALLPTANSLAKLTPDGGYEIIDLDGLTPSRMVASPDDSTLLVFGSYPVCDSDDPDIETVEDCQDAEEDVLTEYELALVHEGGVAAQIPIEGHYNALTFTSDGATAVAYLDYDSSVEVDITGVSNLAEVLFIDLASGEATAVPVGFSADRILFNEDDTLAVVLSRSEVAVVELTSGDYETEVTFPLGLDVDDQVQPEDVELTPDGRYALITIEGSGDLYVLDLEAESINIVSLDAAPADMVVDTVVDRTLLVYGSRPQLDILEHEYFEVESLELDEPTNSLMDLDGQALLFNDASATHDLYRVDLDNYDLIEYRLENPVEWVEVAPNQETAVAVTRPEGASYSDDINALYDARWLVELIDLTDDESIPLIAEAEPVGVAFSGDEAEPDALVLIEGLRELLLVDLLTADAQSVELSDDPLGIGAFGEDWFYIPHDSSLGLVSFVDAETGEITLVNGFATGGLLADETTPLPRREQ